MREGYIYLITNKINGKKYIGQTSRDLYTRFHEHCHEKKGNSKLHYAIQKYGWQNFKIEELEKVPIEELDKKEKYWIEKLDTKNNGYNILIGGQIKTNCNQIKIIENELIFDSKEECAKMISELTSWNISFIRDKIFKCINTEQDFLGYHFQNIETDVSSDLDTLEDWIKTLNIRFQGQHIYCKELQLEFDTVGEAAKYLVDNNYYCGKSQMPIQALVSSIGQNINKKIEYVNSSLGELHFEKIPGITKNQDDNKKIYCPELDKEFESQSAAANYLIENKIWTELN